MPSVTKRTYYSTNVFNKSGNKFGALGTRLHRYATSLTIGNCVELCVLILIRNEKLYPHDSFEKLADGHPGGAIVNSFVVRDSEIY